MSDTLRYKLELGVSDSVDVDDLEDFLQRLLLDLYEQGDVESITVTKDGYVSSSDDDDINALVGLLDDLESEHVKRAIDMVKEMEDVDNDDE
jgi:hypothetical protein